MVPVRHCLLLLWLGWDAAARAQEESVQVIRATESETVTLHCMLGGLGPTLASNYLNLTWLGPLRTMVMNVEVRYRYPGLEAGPDMNWGLLIRNISRQDDMHVTCSREENPANERKVQDYPSEYEYDAKNTEEEMNYYMNYSSSEIPVLKDFTEKGTPFPCNDSAVSNRTWTAISWNPHEITKASLSMKIWQVAPYQLRVSSDTISLLLPSVTFRDAGNYSCYWKNQSQHIRLEVSAQSGVRLYFGKQHWIIWIVALGYMAICLGIFFGLLRFRRGCRARRQKKQQLRSPAMRKFFHAQRNKEPVSGGILLPSANGDGKEPVDVFSYENVSPSVSPSGGQQSLQKGNTLPTATKREDDDDDEEYEHPDSETEQKSDDEDNYENAQEEVKQEDVVLNDGSQYENSKKESCGSADSWYANNSQKGLRDLAQDPVSEDGDNYENVEEESTVSPGAARLIAGLRLQLALDPPVDKQDGGSEASTDYLPETLKTDYLQSFPAFSSSQSYEEMNGTLSPTPSKGLHTSNEEDADSYENMESPNSFSLPKESSLDPQGERAAFGSVRQNLSISFGTDL